MHMKYIFLTLITVIFLSLGVNEAHARCDNPSDYDSAGRRCGGRAASVIPGGRLGGDGRYQDSQGRQRLYGTNNDPYDVPKQPTNNYGYGSSNPYQNSTYSQ